MRLDPFWGKMINLFIALAFIFNVIFSPSIVSAQATVLNLPILGEMVQMTSGFAPAIIKGINIYPEDALKFDFIIDKGDTDFDNEQFKAESLKLIKYFMASLTIPEDEMWVNLSPYEGNRVISDNFGKTEMGRDLLAQDYMLKQVMSSIMYPENEFGQKFWDRVYARIQEEFGTTEIPLNTFNKVWIIASDAKIYEHKKGAFVVDSHIKVILEADYLALEKSKEREELQTRPFAKGQPESKDNAKAISEVLSEVVREILIPEIEREVNEGEIFANLRQIYSSMLLASWYKKTLKESLLGEVYVNQVKTAGVEIKDKEINKKIYNQYVESFKKGVCDFIKEEYDSRTQQIIPRKYFLGGTVLKSDYEGADPEMVSEINPEGFSMVTVRNQGIKNEKQSDGSMTGDDLFNLLVLFSSDGFFSSNSLMTIGMCFEFLKDKDVDGDLDVFVGAISHRYKDWLAKEIKGKTRKIQNNTITEEEFVEMRDMYKDWLNEFEMVMERHKLFFNKFENSEIADILKKSIKISLNDIERIKDVLTALKIFISPNINTSFSQINLKKWFDNMPPQKDNFYKRIIDVVINEDSGFIWANPSLFNIVILALIEESGDAENKKVTIESKKHLKNSQIIITSKREHQESLLEVGEDGEIIKLFEPNYEVEDKIFFEDIRRKLPFAHSAIKLMGGTLKFNKEKYEETGETQYIVTLPNSAEISELNENVVMESLGDSGSLLKGGIDFHPDNLDMQVDNDGNSIVLPVSSQGFDVSMDIKGFISIIINTAPVTNLSVVLGLAQEDQE